MNLHSHLPSLRLGPGALGGEASRCSPTGRYARTGETQVTEEGLKLVVDWSGPSTSRVIRARPGWLAGRLDGPSLRWWVVGGRDHPTEPTTTSRGRGIGTASRPEASPRRRRLSRPQTARPEMSGLGLGGRQHVPRGRLVFIDGHTGRGPWVVSPYLLPEVAREGRLG